MVGDHLVGLDIDIQEKPLVEDGSLAPEGSVVACEAEFVHRVRLRLG